ncbi:aldehyde dehydrogenase family protein [Psychromonas sp. CD1]|uniref:aldehyde dehydrogenase family protein n=1 Tax=Psychromonas sp. CD1 TaxID=1979839 RepID=UPI000B9AA942|nr:aldehyde dehydrogenase family protein [Psychromonas sp. CD1]
MNLFTKNMVTSALDQWEMWNEIGVVARAEFLKVWADELYKSPELGAKCAKMALYQVQQALHLISTEKSMPGPTGETNVLYTTGRGLFVVRMSIDAPFYGVIAHIASALVAGNCLILCLPKAHQILADKLLSSLILAGIPASVVQVSTPEISKVLMKTPLLAGVAYIGNEQECIDINRLLASAPGSIVQLISETDLDKLSTLTDKHFILRYITEKVRTINVTAVGGNAILLELGNGDL